LEASPLIDFSYLICTQSLACVERMRHGFNARSVDFMHLFDKRQYTRHLLHTAIDLIGVNVKLRKFGNRQYNTFIDMERRLSIRRLLCWYYPIMLRHQSFLPIRLSGKAIGFGLVINE
jgi:hypothetical protein